MLNMANDKGEYEETKIRVYKVRHHKDEGTMSKYVVSPVKKALGGKGGKERRLTA